MVAMSKKFAFIIHPINPQRDVSRKYPRLGKLPPWLIDFLSLFFPPVYISQINGVQSQSTGEEISGWFVACPLTPKRMMSLPVPLVYRKIVQTGKLAQRLGASILGLGAFTSVVGDGGITIAKRLKIPVTTGDSYTIAVAGQAIESAAKLMRVSLADSTLGIVGAAGAIGSVCAEQFAPKVAKIILVGRESALDRTVQRVQNAGNPQLQTSADINELKSADLIITVTSAIDAIIQPHHLKKGAVVCDVARPRDVSRQVAASRPDVFVIEGGMVAVPGTVDFGFNFGFPPKMAYACMAETMALALEGRFEPYTLGKNISLSQVEAIDRIAANHGFQLGGFRSFEKAITAEEISEIQRFAGITAPNPAS